MKHLFKKNDLIIFAAAAFLIAFSLLLVRFLGRNPADAVEISVGGRITASYPLNVNGSYSVTGADGGLVFFTVDNRSVDVTGAECPNKICVSHAPITRSGESIVCLPNRVVITLTNHSGETEIDAVAR